MYAPFLTSLSSESSSNTTGGKGQPPHPLQLQWFLSKIEDIQVLVINITYTKRYSKKKKKILSRLLKGKSATGPPHWSFLKQWHINQCHSLSFCSSERKNEAQKNAHNHFSFKKREQVLDRI